MTQPDLWLSIKARCLEVSTGAILGSDVGRVAALRDDLTAHVDAVMNPPGPPPPPATEPGTAGGPPPATPAPNPSAPPPPPRRPPGGGRR